MDELYTELAAFRVRPTLVGALLVAVAWAMVQSDAATARFYPPCEQARGD